MSSDQLNQIGPIIEDHPSIDNIELIGCCSANTNGYDMLRSIIDAGASKLVAIDLSSNFISTGGSTFIADFLANNPMLQTLILWGNEFNDTDAISIANALNSNTNLFSLDLRRNAITEAGWGVLRKTEFDPSSLNSAADSNHTCSIEEIAEYNTWSDDEYFKAVRQKKIYHVLSSRNKENTNVQYFDDDMPVEILPDMLRSIQQYSEYHIGQEDEEVPERGEEDSTSLSIVFEVMRRWEKVFSVYECLGSGSMSSQKSALVHK